MCLISKTKFPKIAEKDIEVFKVVNCQICKKRIYQPDGKKYRYKISLEIATPYQHIEIPTLPYKFVAEGKELITEDNHSCTIIESGFIHAYRNILRGCFVSGHYRRGLIKAIIPANTAYFIGELNEICAKEIYLQGFIQFDQEDDFFKLLNKYFPKIPVFDINTITFKQVNPLVEESIEIKEPIEELEEVYV